MGTAIVIASGKGGTGKTTSAAAIACALAEQGKMVLCVDCDIGLRNLDLSLGLADTAAVTFADVLEGRAGMDSAVTHPKFETLRFITAPYYDDFTSLSEPSMKAFIRKAKIKFDFCILDAPAGIGAGFRLAAANADAAIVVSTADASSLRDGQRTVAELEKLKIRSIRMLVNRVTSRRLKRTQSTIDDVIDAVGARLLGIISEDETVTMAANMEIPLLTVPTSKAAEQYRRVARRLLGEDVPIGRL